jgi:NDP-sugar pyrophosphorylase family protein
MLAAGRGTRLAPLTDEYPKPLLPINNTPVLKTLYEMIVWMGFNDLQIVVGYKEEMIRKFIASLIEHSLDVQKPTFVLQPELRGSGYGLQCLLKDRPKQGNSLIMACDRHFRAREIVLAGENFLKSDAIAMMCVHQEKISDLPKGHTVVMDHLGQVTKVWDYPAADASLGFAAAPMFFVKKEFWPYVENLNGNSIELATALQQAIEDGHKVISTIVSPEIEITTPQDLLLANFSYLKKL